MEIFGTLFVGLCIGFVIGMYIMGQYVDSHPEEYLPPNMTPVTITPSPTVSWSIDR